MSSFYKWVEIGREGDIYHGMDKSEQDARATFEGKLVASERAGILWGYLEYFGVIPVLRDFFDGKEENVQKQVWFSLDSWTALLEIPYSIPLAERIIALLATTGVFELEDDQQDETNGNRIFYFKMNLGLGDLDSFKLKLDPTNEARECEVIYEPYEFSETRQKVIVNCGENI